MAHRKWKETKQEPGTAGPGIMLGYCLVSFHFLWAILSTSTVLRSVDLWARKCVKNVPLFVAQFLALISKYYQKIHKPEYRSKLLISKFRGRGVYWVKMALRHIGRVDALRRSICNSDLK